MRLNHTVATQDSGISRPDSSLLCTHISPVCPSPGPSHHQCVHAWFSRGWQRVSLWRREREAGGPLFRDLHLPFCPSRYNAVELAGPLGTLLGSAQWKRASSQGEAGQESQASSCLRKGTPLASRVAQGVSGPPSSYVWNPRPVTNSNNSIKCSTNA